MAENPKSRAGRRDPRAGFVLIDLVAATAIMALMIALVLPMIAEYTVSARMHLLLANTASLLRDARTVAIAENDDETATFDAEQRVIRFGHRSVHLPADVALSVTSGGGCTSDGDVTEITFHPDGTNCGGVLRFARGEEVFRLRVNWATGYVDMLKG
ncbi:MAG TPA: hypothetical protein VKV77_01510 [Methylovirgula sp.]|nr:hypothetical protein [Methylovirgula sp.]